MLYLFQFQQKNIILSAKILISTMQMLKSLTIFFISLASLSAHAAEGCKAYVRLDLGYSMASGTKVSGPGFLVTDSSIPPSILPMSHNFSLDRNPRGIIGDLAVGYYFNDAMRGEISFDFKPKIIAQSLTFESETQEYGGSARVLYDFNNNTSVTPFVFGGLGAMNIKPKINPFVIKMFKEPYTQAYLTHINDDGSLKTNATNQVITYSSLKMPSKIVMTYQAGFGLAFKASEEVSIDLTYSLGGKTDYQVLVNTGSAIAPAGTAFTESQITNEDRFKQLKFKNQMNQSLTIGLRFTI